MISRVEVFSQQPGVPELPLGGFVANSDPVQVRDIQGLGPVKSDILSTAFATGKGELYQGSSVGKRNIVMTLGLNPDWEEQTMASLRQLLYRYLMTQQWTKLRFRSTEMPTVDIEGYVESFDPNIFSQDPEVQVSIICPKPDFVEADATIYYGVVDDGSVEIEFEYQGTVETGFEVRIVQTVDNPGYTGIIDVTMKSPDEPQIISIDPVTIDGVYYFKLNTNQGRKRASRITTVDGTVLNLLRQVNTASVWPVVKPGTNVFSVAATETGQSWTLAYFNRFGGL